MPCLKEVMKGVNRQVLAEKEFNILVDTVSDTVSEAKQYHQHTGVKVCIERIKALHIMHDVAVPLSSIVISIVKQALCCHSTSLSFQKNANNNLYTL